MGRLRGAGDFGEDFGGDGLANGAGGVVNAALCERELATAGAGFGVEAVDGDFFLFGSEEREIDAGKFGGTVGVFQKDFSRVLERFDFRFDR